MTKRSQQEDHHACTAAEPPDPQQRPGGLLMLVLSTQVIGHIRTESHRMKEAQKSWLTNRWPLIELRMSRHDCLRWIEANGFPKPPRSACVFCPYHDMATWRELKMSGNGDWKTAVEVDEMIRKARPPYDLFVHPARIPLEQVDVRNLEDKGQLRLWDEECEGYCGI